MPEGDTIHRAAAALRRGLVGATLRRVEIPRSRTSLPTVGATVTRVEARGKHLLVATSDDRIVHTHQRMTGAWHLYRPRERWRKPAAQARVVLGTDAVIAVCFSSPVVEVLDSAALRRHPALRALGPDLCDPGADLDEVVARLVRLVDPDRSIGEALLDQRVASGIGNVYRCDVLFLHGIDPAAPYRTVTAGQARQLFHDAGVLLRANLDGVHRTTVPGGPPGALWTHGRAGQPCRRCGTTIALERLGEQARYVYRCPTCQPRHPDAVLSVHPA